jgi:hypothetical protein
MARKHKRIGSGFPSKSNRKVASKTRKPRKAASSTGKIKATRKEVDGIQFKSALEVFTYRKLKEAGLQTAYEEHTFTLLDGFVYPETCIESRKSPDFEDKKDSKLRPITYTPDFVGTYPDGSLMWVIECKGFANDRFPNTWKTFKVHLINTGQVCPLFLPKNQKQVLEVIEHLKERFLSES